MRKTKIIKLISLCSANYRNWPEEDKEEATIELWESMLGDLSFEVGQAAVKAHMSKSVFPPTIADIRDAAAMITSPPQMDAIVAWDLIGQAIRKYGFYRGDEAMASLPHPVADMARRFTWRELCLSENIDTLRAQFRMAWDAQNKRQQQERILPPDVMQLIESSNVIKRLE